MVAIYFYLTYYLVYKLEVYKVQYIFYWVVLISGGNQIRLL